MKDQKIVIALSLNGASHHLLRDWGKKFDFEVASVIHFVHVVKKNLTPFEYGIMENPDDETFEEMKPTLKQYLLDESKNIVPENFHGKLETHVMKGYYPEQEVVRFLEHVDADLIVVAKEKHGLEGIFHHSFTEHMIKNASCNVFVVRDET